MLSWLAYVSACLCRTNLSIALPEMVKSLDLSKTQAGLLGTAFFWAYAVGQLINGNLGDRFKSGRFIFIGLILAAVVNVIVVFSSNYLLILILWAVNGYFLSFLLQVILIQD